jgi:hypothetical protein
MEGREGRGGRGKERVKRAARGRSRTPTTSRCPPATGIIAICASTNLLLKHLDKTFATYVYRQMKHLKHTSKTLAKTPENT